MGGTSKALLPLAGKPLLGHVIERLAPQVEALSLSVERHDTALEIFGLAQIADPVPGGNGPLGGLLASLEELPAERDWLLLAPCDAPILPRDLGVRLLQAAREHRSPGAVARYQGELQPTFSLWHRDLLPLLHRAVRGQRLGGFKQFLSLHPLPAVDWAATEPTPFFNVNTPEELRQAESLVDLAA